MDNVALRVSNVTKSYGKRTVLDSLDLTVHKGSFVTLLGSSGSGKSTLFRCITGLDSIDSGRIVAFGESKSVHELTSAQLCQLRRDIGFVFQQFNLIKRFTAYENVLGACLASTPFWRVAFRNFNKDDRHLALECLDRVEMLSFANTPVQKLSGGQQQRIAVARVLAQKPKLIIADEPVSSLDPLTAASVLKTLKTAARESNVAVLCSLHQVELAIDVADHIIGIKGGRVQLDLANDPEDLAMGSKITSLYERVIGESCVRIGNPVE
jgi:phosphonate transport system ATP-binding protein